MFVLQSHVWTQGLQIPGKHTDAKLYPRPAFIIVIQNV